MPLGTMIQIHKPLSDGAFWENAKNFGAMIYTRTQGTKDEGGFEKLGPKEKKWLPPR